jgi:hypothetical protein
MIITKKAIPRRAVLRGAGASLALPFLDAMTPALAAVATRPIRMAFIAVPNGIIQGGKYTVPEGQWTPTVTGSGFDMPRTLAPIARFRENMLLLTGLDQKEARPLSFEIAGEHPRSCTAWTTGTHAKMTAGADVHAGISVDQIAARELGKYTQYASLEVSLEPKDVVGACEAYYACCYFNTMSWRNATTPLPMENRPRALFERLFADMAGTNARTRLIQRKHQNSILDAVTGNIGRLQGELGGADRSKMEQYLDAVRDAERRIQLAEVQAGRELPASAKNLPIEGVTGIPPQFSDHYKLMADLMVLAWQADLTRVITFQVGHEMSGRSYPECGVNDAHHLLTHHGGDMEKIRKVIQIEMFHTGLLGYYLDKLQSTPDGDGTLLDHAMVLYGSPLSDGNMHLPDNLPNMLLAGRETGFKGGQHIRYPKGTPMTNLFLTMLDAAGIPHVPSIGDSTGRLALQSA